MELDTDRIERNPERQGLRMATLFTKAFWGLPLPTILAERAVWPGPKTVRRREMRGRDGRREQGETNGFLYFYWGLKCATLNYL